MTDVIAEMDLTTRASEAAAKLRSLGVSSETIVRCDRMAGAIGFGRIRVTKAGFEFQEDGDERICFAWREPDEDFRDIIAFDPDNPSQAWTRYGAAGVLNEYELVRSVACQQPVQVRRDVLSWLRNDLHGIVILDHRSAWWRFMDAELVAEDVPHGRKLRAWLRRPDPKISILRPNISVPASEAPWAAA